MTNAEYYKERISAMDYDIAMNENENGKLVTCHGSGIRCEDCGFNSYNGCVGSCRQATVKWLLSEYEEPQVDWSKVPIDTPVLVRKSEVDTWRRRYFAGIREGMVTAYPAGRTSWSDDSGECDDTLISWPIAKLF